MLRAKVLPRTIAGLFEGPLRIFNAKEASMEVETSPGRSGAIPYETSEFCFDNNQGHEAGESGSESKSCPIE
jgi:hypothetical protein